MSPDKKKETHDIIPTWHASTKVLWKEISAFLLLSESGKHTTVMGIGGAFGNMNLTSSNFCLRLQFSASPTHPAPLSPSPWAIMTVAVCLFTAGTIKALAEGMFATAQMMNMNTRDLLLKRRT